MEEAKEKNKELKPRKNERKNKALVEKEAKRKRNDWEKGELRRKKKKESGRYLAKQKNIKIFSKYGYTEETKDDFFFRKNRII